MKNRFENTKENRNVDPMAMSIVLFVAIMIGFIMGIGYVSGSRYLDDEATLEEAISRDIVHCYAVEGSYPESLEYMEDNYGLIYDHSKYIVDYEFHGANIIPSVMVLERSSR